MLCSIGKKKINPDDYTGLKINITLSDSGFMIEDNCGGFSLEVAQKYAFRFGRPDEAPKAHGTVGRFGIGMKRSLFKIGKEFVIESQYNDDHFKVIVNVDEWSKKTKIVTANDGNELEIDDWNFNYQSIDNNKMDNDGTIIKVSNLNHEVTDLFCDNTFLNELANDIQKLLNFSLLKGIQITLNGRILKGNRIDVLLSESVLPFYANGKINDVSYRVIAGLGEIVEPKNSGWYIYCNNRLVVEADNSNITG